MTVDAKPLTEKQAAFAWAYEGDGVSAARRAGYGGSAASLAVTASRLLRDPRVQAILEQRRRDAGIPPRAPGPVPVETPEPEPVEPGDLPLPEPPAAAPKLRRVNVHAEEERARSLGVDPIAILAEIASGPDVHHSSRVAAAKALERHQRETHQTTADPHADLRAKVIQIVLERRVREREERET